MKDAEFTGQTDEQLMTRARTDDRSAFAELYDRHCALAFRIALSICHDRTRAEDAVQDGFLAIWRSRKTYKPQSGAFRAWAMRIMRNRAIDQQRSVSARNQSWGPPSEETPEMGAKSPPELVIDRAESVQLHASLGRIPREQAEVISLSYFEELSQTEIASVLSLPHGTVKGRMRLGLQKLRTQMEAPS